MGSIPGFAQWVKGSGVVVSWLWCRLAAVAPLRPLAWEPRYATGAALKRKEKKKKKGKVWGLGDDLPSPTLGCCTSRLWALQAPDPCLPWSPACSIPNSLPQFTTSDPPWLAPRILLYLLFKNVFSETILNPQIP